MGVQRESYITISMDMILLNAVIQISMTVIGITIDNSLIDISVGVTVHYIKKRSFVSSIGSVKITLFAHVSRLSVIFVFITINIIITGYYHRQANVPFLILST